jgi:hypothetical protein
MCYLLLQLPSACLFVVQVPPFIMFHKVRASPIDSLKCRGHIQFYPAILGVLGTGAVVIVSNRYNVAPVCSFIVPVLGVLGTGMTAAILDALKYNACIERGFSYALKRSVQTVAQTSFYTICASNKIKQIIINKM